jgi:hypothetical protein
MLTFTLLINSGDTGSHIPARESDVKVGAIEFGGGKVWVFAREEPMSQGDSRLGSGFRQRHGYQHGGSGFDLWR